MQNQMLGIPQLAYALGWSPSKTRTWLEHQIKSGQPYAYDFRPGHGPGKHAIPKVSRYHPILSGLDQGRQELEDLPKVYTSAELTRLCAIGYPTYQEWRAHPRFPLTPVPLGTKHIIYLADEVHAWLGGVPAVWTVSFDPPYTKNGTFPTPKTAEVTGLTEDRLREIIREELDRFTRQMGE